MKNRILFLIPVIAILFFGFFSVVSADDTGWQAPTSTGAIFNGWTYPAEVYVLDTSTSISAGTSEQSYSDFSFDIPDRAIINEIQFGVYARGNLDKTLTIYLSGDNGNTWTESKSIVILTGAHPSYPFYTTIADLWGKSWETSEFSDENFVLRVGSAPTGNIYVDALRIRIDYTPISIIPVSRFTAIGNITAYISDLFSSFGIFIWLIVGIPLAFWVFMKVLVLLTQDKKLAKAIEISANKKTKRELKTWNKRERENDDRDLKRWEKRMDRD